MFILGTTAKDAQNQQKNTTKVNTRIGNLKSIGAHTFLKNVYKIPLLGLDFSEDCGSLPFILKAKQHNNNKIQLIAKKSFF